MPSRALLVTALTLTALGLAPGAAHLMELPVKLGYPPILYAEVTSTLYAWFGIAGGSVQVAAVIVVTLLAIRSRRLPSAGLVSTSAASLVVSLLLWGFLVSPVNSAWARSMGAEPTEFAAAYMRLQARWEYGHVAAFFAWLSGWFGLVAALTKPPLTNLQPD